MPEWDLEVVALSSVFLLLQNLLSRTTVFSANDGLHVTLRTMDLLPNSSEDSPLGCVSITGQTRQLQHLQSGA